MPGSRLERGGGWAAAAAAAAAALLLMASPVDGLIPNLARPGGAGRGLAPCWSSSSGSTNGGINDAPTGATDGHLSTPGSEASVGGGVGLEGGAISGRRSVSRRMGERIGKQWQEQYDKAKTTIDNLLGDVGVEVPQMQVALERMRRPRTNRRLEKLQAQFRESILKQVPGGSTSRNMTALEEEAALAAFTEGTEGYESYLSTIIPSTDMSSPDRHILVVTTAALPWMTGTSVNPLLRAAYLCRGREAGKVTIMLPWLEDKKDQAQVFTHDTFFDSAEEQQEVVTKWLIAANLEEEVAKLKFVWYDARYLGFTGSIFPMGDITRLVPDEEADVCIMEEPEHLNWYRATGVNWAHKFEHVVGIIHTNYAFYTSKEEATAAWSGQLKENWVLGFNKLMARAYCDKVVKLSATLQVFAKEKESVCNVHGVREGFLEVGDAVKRHKEGSHHRGERLKQDAGAYMLGKMLWEKGYDRLFDFMADAVEEFGQEAAFPIDIYGHGPESELIQAGAKEKGVPATFHPAIDHAALGKYRVFVNPSVSEVLCTTVAEALAMGKWVVIARHPSNEFFYQFSNCLPFDTLTEFRDAISKALSEDPKPLPEDQRRSLTWEAATERLVEASKVTVREEKQRRADLDNMAWTFHYHLGAGERGDIVRKFLLGGVVADQNAFTAAKYDEFDPEVLERRRKRKVFLASVRSVPRKALKRLGTAKPVTPWVGLGGVASWEAQQSQTEMAETEETEEADGTTDDAAEEGNSEEAEHGGDPLPREE